MNDERTVTSNALSDAVPGEGKGAAPGIAAPPSPPPPTPVTAAAAEGGPVPEAEHPLDWAEIVITVDHVYLPLSPDGKNAVADWATTSISTTRVPRRTRLRVPTDLALYLSGERDQAEIL